MKPKWHRNKWSTAHPPGFKQERSGHWVSSVISRLRQRWVTERPRHSPLHFRLILNFNQNAPTYIQYIEKIVVLFVWSKFLTLQAHPTSALEGLAPQPNAFTNYPAGPGNPFPLQPGLHPQLGWQWYLRSLRLRSSTVITCWPLLSMPCLDLQQIVFVSKRKTEDCEMKR